MAVERIALPGGEIEFERVPSANPRSRARAIVMLHQALGSLSQWRGFPQRLADGTGCPVLAYSRFGHGQSSPSGAPRTARFIHDEALVVLPALLDALGVECPVLFGHSDGASIALLHAGAARRGVAGVVALAPHLFVEERTLRGIEATRDAWRTTGLPERLALHHRDAGTVFRDWHETWLAPSMRSWSIEDAVRAIACPVAAIQGVDDEYGTMEQVRRIGRLAADAEVLELEECGHSPHRDRPRAVIEATARVAERRGRA